MSKTAIKILALTAALNIAGEQVYLKGWETGNPAYHPLACLPIRLLENHKGDKSRTGTIFQQGGQDQNPVLACNMICINVLKLDRWSLPLF